MKHLLTIQPSDIDPKFADDFGCEGCTQTLVPISFGQVRRTINGDLIHFGDHSQKKFKSVITGSGQVQLALTVGWQGITLRVSCLQPLVQVIPDALTLALERDPVPQSIWIQSKDTVTFQGEKRLITLSEKTSGLIHYRPQLTMRVLDFHLETKELEMVSPWRLELEEV